MTTCDADAIPELISCFVPIRRLVADFGLETGMYNSTLQKKKHAGNSTVSIACACTYLRMIVGTGSPTFRSDHKQRAGGAYVTSRRSKVAAFPGRAGGRSQLAL